MRVDRRTQELEPWLAESWTASADGLTYTLKLRPGVTFSDGAPFTSADVVFAFKALYDEKTRQLLGDSMRVGGKPLAVSARRTPRTVVVTFPSPFGPGIRLLDNLPILPRHKLEAALNAGTLAKAWDVSTPPADIVGPRARSCSRRTSPASGWCSCATRATGARTSGGARLPVLDRLTLEIVPDQNAEVLALQTGQIDFTQTEVRPEDYATLKRAADAGKLTIADLGVGLDADSFWLNLRPGRPAVDEASLAAAQRTPARHLARGRSPGVRRDGVPRRGGARSTGRSRRATSAGMRPTCPQPTYDPAEAKRLLAGLGLADRNGDGMLEDRTGRAGGLHRS